MKEKSHYNFSTVNENILLLEYWQKGTGVQFTELQF